MIVDFETIALRALEKSDTWTPDQAEKVAAEISSVNVGAEITNDFPDDAWINVDMRSSSNCAIINSYLPLVIFHESMLIQNYENIEYYSYGSWGEENLLIDMHVMKKVFGVTSFDKSILTGLISVHSLYFYTALDQVKITNLFGR